MSRPYIRAVELFRGTSDLEARKISRLCREKRFTQGATIFSQGELSDSLYILKDGLVKLMSVSNRGAATILHILKPDEIFGELFLSEEKRPFTAIAIEEASVTILYRELFLKLLSWVPTVALNFIRLLSKRLAQVEKGLVESGHTWSYHRLAKLLLQLSEKYGTDVANGTLINLRLTHEDLANLIGTSRETVTTQLNNFKRLGLLNRRARRLIVTKPRLTEFIRSREL